MSEIVLNVAFVLYVGASWLKRELWLRIGLMGSSLGSLIFGILIDSPTSIVWNMLFLVATGYRVVQMLRADANIELTDEEASMHRRVFPSLDRAEFLRVWEVGVDLEFRTAPLVIEGRPVDRLVLLLDGEAAVERGDRRLAVLTSGTFAGEMAFATGADASATVRPMGPVRGRVWSTDMLRGVLRANPELTSKLERVISSDLVAKLSASEPARIAAATG